MIVAREGQHSGVAATPFAKSAPPWTNSSRVFGITSSVSNRWSSVTMIRTFGGLPGRGGPVGGIGPVVVAGGLRTVPPAVVPATDEVGVGPGFAVHDARRSTARTAEHSARPVSRLQG